MKLSEERLKFVHGLIDAIREKGYNRETYELLIIFSRTIKLKDRNINPDIAIEKFTDIVKASVDEEDCLTKVCDFVDGV